MRATPLKYTCFLAAAIPVLHLGSQVVAQQNVEVSITAPTWDRWMYPYNFQPGERVAGPTFGAYGSTYYDDRAGQNLISFDTRESITDGLGAGSYDIISGRMTIMVLDNNTFYDPTPDSWQTWLGAEDDDLGRACIISGAGFRGGYDGWSFGDDGDWGVVEHYGRNVYPIGFVDGDPVDISRNLAEGWDPKPFGVGETDEVSIGEPMPDLTTLTFELDTSDPDIQCYLRNALDDGLLSLVLSSLHYGSHDGGSYPQFIMQENSLVFAGLANGSGLELEVVVTQPSSVAGDINNDGGVDVSDLLRVINEWGCSCCISDINSDGRTDVSDLLAVINNWGG